MSVIEKEQDGKLSGIFHCFSGSVEEAARIIAAGFYLGIGGAVTYRNSSLPEVLKKTGPDRLVLETDAPWLSPLPKRGTRNESSYLPYTAARVAEIFGMTTEQFARLTTANASKIFNLY
jgi:TatD DNase family protein